MEAAIQKIKESTWRIDALAMADTHFPPGAGITLADHLTAAYGGLINLLTNKYLAYPPLLQGTLKSTDFDLTGLRETFE